MKCGLFLLVIFITSCWSKCPLRGRPVVEWVDPHAGSAEVKWKNIVENTDCIDGYMIRFQNVKARVTLVQAHYRPIETSAEILRQVAEEAGEDLEIFHAAEREAQFYNKVARANAEADLVIDTPYIEDALANTYIMKKLNSNLPYLVSVIGTEKGSSRRNESSKALLKPFESDYWWEALNEF